MAEKQSESAMMLLQVASATVLVDLPELLKFSHSIPKSAAEAMGRHSASALGRTAHALKSKE